MKRIVFCAIAVFVLQDAPPVFADEPNGCAFDSYGGIEFRFPKDPALEAKWAKKFSPTKDFSEKVDAGQLSGRNAKIVVVQSSGVDSPKISEIITDQCVTVFMKNKDGRIAPSAEADLGIVLIDELPSVWTTQESIDPMTDARSCLVTASFENGKPLPFFLYHSIEGFAATAYGADFPGRPVTFRVDSNKAISEESALSGQRAQKLVDQIRARGQILRVSGYEWPYDFAKLNELPISGLSQKLDYCRAWVRQPN